MNSTRVFALMNSRIKALVASFLVVMLPLPANAATLTTWGDNYFAFVFGMTFAVIVTFTLLKPLASIAKRSPLILSGILLIQSYAMEYVQENQLSVLLVSAGAFICTLFIAIFVDKLTNKKTSIVTAMLGLVFCLFLGAYFFVPTANVAQLWLGFTVITLIIAGVGLYLLSKQGEHNITSSRVIWLFILLNSGVVYLWLTKHIAAHWLILSATGLYLIYVIQLCRGITKNILQQLKSFSDEASKTEQETYGVSSSLDPVTNLPNYHQSLDCLRHFNHQDPSSLVVVIFKPINFVQVNKILGHHNSDILLLQLAYTLQKSLVDNELLVNFNKTQPAIRIARLQGLDFIVALDANASHHPIKILVEQVCQQLSEAVPNAMSFKSFSLNFDLKFGVAFVNEHQNDLEQTIASAGDALLESENSHQAVHYFNHETAIYTEKKLLLMEKLKQDILEDKLSWLIQPQISLNENRLVGFELSTDWRASDNIAIDTKEFIEIAEYSGEIYQLTRQIIVQACKLIARLHRENFYIQVSINLTSKDVLEPELVEFIEEISEKHYVSLRYLVIEIDEALLFNATNKTKLIIDQLKSIGVKVSINKFSGSYEALRYLRRLAIDQVKVDCSQLAGTLNESQSEKTIISALINLIRKMEMPFVASGINNSEIKNTYIDIGGDIGQGNLITSGIKLEDAKEWAAQWLIDHVEKGA
ncbi:EAL domain-containing protein [Thalassotalea piscium]